MIADQLPARDRQADDVADELADGRERSVADPLEVGDQGGQLRPDQAAAFDPDRERGLVESSDNTGTMPDDCGALGSTAAPR